MKLTVLGMQGPFPSEGGATSGYLLQTGGKNILIDCGTGVLSELVRYLRPEQLDAVILSHLHYDHMSDMLPMQYALQFAGRGTPIPVYCPEKPTYVRKTLEHTYYTLRDVEDFQLGNSSFSFLPAVHPVPGFSVRIEEHMGTDANATGNVLVYTGDTNWHEMLAPFAHDCDLLLADAAFLKKDWTIEKPHMSAAHCAELAVACKAQKLILTHLRPYIPSEEILKEAREGFENCVLAEKGMTVTIGE